MSRRPLIAWIVVVALVAATVVWAGYAYRALQPDGGLVGAGDRLWLLGLVGLGSALDALVAVRLLRGRIGRGDLIWLGLRCLLSVVGFLFLTLPFYGIAFVLLSSAPRSDPRTDASLPHGYRPISAGWFGALTPLWWSQSILGASQIGQSWCVVCRQDRNAPIHAAVG
jgi:hypothetical protein